MTKRGIIPSSPRVLIVKLSAIGDVVHTLPALNALRRHRPKAHITWLVEEAAADLIRGHAAIDQVLVSRRKLWARGLRSGGWQSHLREMRAFLRQLRATRYDMVIDFQANLKGAALIALTRANRKIGFGRGMTHQEYSYLALNAKIPMVGMHVHALKRGLMLMEAIGVPGPRVEYDLPVDRSARDRAARLVAENRSIHDGRLVAINPMAQWDTKLWTPDKFADLADRLIADYGADIFFSGAPTDAQTIAGITRLMKHRAANLAGQTTLIELAALFESMDFVISTDTGPMHIAAAVGTPVVALFGPTAQWRTGPYGEGHRIVFKTVACRPCFKRRCDHVRCMRSITVDDVFVSIDKVMQAGYSR